MIKPYWIGLACWIALSWAEPINLDTMIDSMVIETKKIDVPGYPLAFNPSIIRWQGNLLMSFRVIPNRSQSFTSQMGLVWLDDRFCPISEPQFIDVRSTGSNIPSRAEDARLVQIGNQLWIVYSDNVDSTITAGGFRVWIAEVLFDGVSFSLFQTEPLLRFNGMIPARREKNWVPFDYMGDLHLAYSLTPHYILRPLLGQSTCETIDITAPSLPYDSEQWGEPRGGTPALFDQGEYLAFFHSSCRLASTYSDGKEMLHYFIGAYTFEAHPPFSITRMSKKPIVGKTFYQGPVYKHYWKPVRVVFPCGYIIDGNYLWIAYGRQDHELWVAKIDKQKLIESMELVTKR
ncbi:MAG: hypothetical protein RL235_992 [Chlamydiota bacterium]|jgi:predicted GH43/DUF377 family glycosyl hydrolase